jgi:hypothetical protein
MKSTDSGKPNSSNKNIRKPTNGFNSTNPAVIKVADVHPTSSQPKSEEETVPAKPLSNKAEVETDSKEADGAEESRQWVERPSKSHRRHHRHPEAQPKTTPVASVEPEAEKPEDTSPSSTVVAEQSAGPVTHRKPKKGPKAGKPKKEQGTHAAAVFAPAAASSDSLEESDLSTPYDESSPKTIFLSMLWTMFLSLSESLTHRLSRASRTCALSRVISQLIALFYLPFTTGGSIISTTLSVALCRKSVKSLFKFGPSEADVVADNQAKPRLPRPRTTVHAPDTFLGQGMTCFPCLFFLPLLQSSFFRAFVCSLAYVIVDRRNFARYLLGCDLFPWSPS